MAERKVLSIADKIIRTVGVIALLPFAVIALFLGAMSTDAPGSSAFTPFLILLIGGALASLILVSALNPKALTNMLGRFGGKGDLFGRVPAYIYAAFAVVYAVMLFA